MPNEQLVVSTKRLGTDLRDLLTRLRKTYAKTQQVISAEVKQQATILAETWIADLSQRPEITAYVSDKCLSELNVHFQRLLVYPEKATIRRRYEEEINPILKDYTPNVVVPLMQGIGRAVAGGTGQVAAAIPPKPNAEGFQPTAFVGHSFSPEDEGIVESVTQALEAIGIRVVTGQKPKAEKISDKVKSLLEAQHIFVGIFTRRDKLAGKNKWTTSAWIIDEKAYASKDKKLILLKEEGVESIGGIQGDHEFIEFTRNKFDKTIVSLLQVFKCSTEGLQ